MRKRLWLVGAALAVVLALAGGALSAQTITEAETLSLVLVTTRSTEIDVGKPGFGPGDYFVERERVYNESESAVLGSGFVKCTFGFRELVCDAVLRIRGRGQISATGAGFASEETTRFTVGITGGTGEFQNVRGEGHVRFTGGRRALLTLHLLP
jgi:hypothetical protein